MKNYSAYLFDLDETIYPKKCGLLNEVSFRIGKYIEHFLKLSPQKADEIRIYYRDTYGSSLAGLMLHHNASHNDYAEFVYDIDYDSYISYNPILYNMLKNIKARKFIYTNASRIHADKVLNRLGVNGLFERIISIEDVYFYTKPQLQSYREMLRITNIDVKNSIFFDDQIKNLESAKRFGITTAFVGGKDPKADLSIDLLTDFRGL